MSKDSSCNTKVDRVSTLCADGVLSPTINKEIGDASKSNYNDDGYLCEVNDMLRNMNTDENNTVLSVCANCGKEGSDNDMNACNTCKQVKYCNAICKKVHKKKHKKECDEYVRLAGLKHDCELFKQPPPKEDCPLCLLRMPTLDSGSKYMTCCGKIICSGCMYTVIRTTKTDATTLCPFCRVPIPKKDEEIFGRERKRLEEGDAQAFFNVGSDYRDGVDGYPRNYKKAMEHWHRAGELGHASAYNSIGLAYENGRGVEVDEKKATYYYELAAMGGNALARYNLGINEEEAGNMDRALRHHMIAVRAGENDSVKEIQELYSKGHATKEDYTIALQSYQKHLSEIKSEQRDKAAAANDEYRYY